MNAPAWMQVTLFAVLALLTAAAVVGDAARRIMTRRRTLSERQLLAHDARKAREQAHGLGFPWLESDGTLSWPPVKVTGEDIARAMHARRLAAQPEVIGDVTVDDVRPTAAEWNAAIRDNLGMTADEFADRLHAGLSKAVRPVDCSTGDRSPLGSATWQSVPDAIVIDTSGPDVSGD